MLAAVAFLALIGLAAFCLWSRHPVGILGFFACCAMAAAMVQGGALSS